ncbi:hypothetical protein C2845_PM03G34720 [Panicum miliaceum]|uniref:Uncharacterized protein n=1 Tax=Panicum miliaceum TaxID=4540 RepID=A0A3L6TCY5_PANMI|nr:hypothetical protein C2845_PM03G34720 [Panicum miliaceum]
MVAIHHSPLADLSPALQRPSAVPICSKQAIIDSSLTCCPESRLASQIEDCTCTSILTGSSPDENGDAGTELDNSVPNKHETRFGRCYSEAKAACKQAREAYLLSGKLEDKLATFLISHPMRRLEEAPKDLVDKLTLNNGIAEMEAVTEQREWSEELLKGLGVSFGDLSGCYQFQF